MCRLGRMQRRKDEGRFSMFYFIVFFYVQGIETTSESYNVLSDYNSRKTSSQSEVNVEGSGGLSSQDGVSKQEETVPLSLPQLNLLFETSFVRDERSVSNRYSATGSPSLTSNLCFRARLSHRAEQLILRSKRCIVTTVEDSVLRTEMTGLESQEEDTPNRILFFNPMSWLGQIRPHRRDKTWSASL
jgi:hypothetical protein